MSRDVLHRALMPQAFQVPLKRMASENHLKAVLYQLIAHMEAHSTSMTPPLSESNVGGPEPRIHNLLKKAIIPKSSAKLQADAYLQSTIYIAE